MPTTAIVPRRPTPADVDSTLTAGERVARALAWFWPALRRVVELVVLLAVVLAAFAGLTAWVAGSIGATLPDPRRYAVFDRVLAALRPVPFLALGFAALMLASWWAYRRQVRAKAEMDLRPPLLMQQVRWLDPADLVPHYVPRVYVARQAANGGQAEGTVLEALRRAAAAPGTPLGICIFGRPMEGKTRLAWEAVAAALPQWTLVRWPHSTSGPFDIESVRGRHVVLWLDGLEDYANPSDAPILEDLPRLFERARARLVVVATCRTGEGETRARSALGRLVELLREVRLGDISAAQADRVVAGLTNRGLEAYRSEFDGTPGSLSLGLRTMRAQRYRALPEDARRVLRALKLLRSTGIRTYSQRRTRATAEDVFDLPPDGHAWRVACTALVRAGFLRGGRGGMPRRRWIEPTAEVYLEYAAADYPEQGMSEQDDWTRLRRSMASRRDAGGLLVLGNAFRERGPGEWQANAQDAALCYRAALRSVSSRVDPITWAVAQNGLGIALAERAEHAGGEERERLLREAAGAYRAARRTYRRQGVWENWARTQLNLGLALLELSRVAPDAGRARLLRRAIGTLRGELRWHTRQVAPATRALTRSVLAGAEREQARLRARRGPRAVPTLPRPAFPALPRPSLPSMPRPSLPHPAWPDAVSAWPREVGERVASGWSQARGTWAQLSRPLMSRPLTRPRPRMTELGDAEVSIPPAPAPLQLSEPAARGPESGRSSSPPVRPESGPSSPPVRPERVLTPSGAARRGLPGAETTPLAAVGVAWREVTGSVRAAQSSLVAALGRRLALVQAFLLVMEAIRHASRPERAGQSALSADGRVAGLTDGPATTPHVAVRAPDAPPSAPSGPAVAPTPTAMPAAPAEEPPARRPSWIAGGMIAPPAVLGADRMGAAWSAPAPAPPSAPIAPASFPATAPTGEAVAAIRPGAPEAPPVAAPPPAGMPADKTPAGSTPAEAPGRGAAGMDALPPPWTPINWWAASGVHAAVPSAPLVRPERPDTTGAPILPPSPAGNAVSPDAESAARPTPAPAARPAPQTGAQEMPGAAASWRPPAAAPADEVPADTAEPPAGATGESAPQATAGSVSGATGVPALDVPPPSATSDGVPPAPHAGTDGPSGTVVGPEETSAMSGAVDATSASEAGTMLATAAVDAIQATPTPPATKPGSLVDALALALPAALTEALAASGMHAAEPRRPASPAAAPEATRAAPVPPPVPVDAATPLERSPVDGMGWPAEETPVVEAGTSVEAASSAGLSAGAPAGEPAKGAPAAAASEPATATDPAMAPVAAETPAGAVPLPPPEEPSAAPILDQLVISGTAASAEREEGMPSPADDGTPPAEAAPAPMFDASVAGEPPADLPPDMGRAAPPTVQLLTEVVEIAEEEEEDGDE